MKIYTRSGDKGKTSLFDGGRVEKDSIRVESYGTVDELNSYLGFARNFIKDKEIKKIIKDIQRKLFNVGGELATEESENFPEKINEKDVNKIEEIIDHYLEQMNKEEKSRFIIPGSNKGSAALHIARTICRRAERRITTLAGQVEINRHLQQFINRLSDLIYTLARYLETELSYVEFKNNDQDEK
ncbi:MAG: cob(I)yrinic acid a,c-diamide adenosyltransferase [Halanaerobiales bacterium]